ncbi:glutamine amidotransferase [Methylopila turkensis]|uniref:GMP synthase n=1 Tax=Methylopila turkensis TaxID=1437816 RepID=A0A9W6JKZ0_9HYPH|nr:glutamine amidotransferase [Methylopila turkensis]GLK78997.1 GMP synthase [Methylopila turkensis]
MTRRLVRAIRHLHFEDLGSFAGPLRDGGFDIEYVDAASSDLGAVDPLAPDILVVLGGPIGVKDGALYPIVAQEIRLLQARLAADRPTLGVCLGAQLMAAALGAAVYPGRTKEIGWGALDLTDAGARGPLAALEGVAALHWHGDTFDLPQGCDLLASTPVCPAQAFARGPNVLGLQFHAEAQRERFESWLIGHASELAGSGISPARLRADAAVHGDSLPPAAAGMMGRWLDGLRLDGEHART